MPWVPLHTGYICAFEKTFIIRVFQDIMLYQGPSRLLKGLDNTNDPCTRSDHGSTPWSEATQGSATVHEAAVDLENKERRGNRGQRLLFGSSALDAEKPPV